MIARGISRYSSRRPILPESNEVHVDCGHDGSRPDGSVSPCISRHLYAFYTLLSSLLGLFILGHLMPSSPDLTGVSDAPRPTERTPLLPSHGSSQNVNRAEGNDLPHIGVFAANMSLEDLPTYSTENLYPQTLSSRPAQTAFALCVLLFYRKSIAGDKSARGRDVWTQWREKAQHFVGINDLDALALRVWTEFLEDDGTAEDVEEVLWSAYPIEPFSTVTVRGKLFPTNLLSLHS